MKKSHRKDVILARIIFAFIILALIAGLFYGGKFLFEKYTQVVNDRKQEAIDTETESESEYIPDFVDTEDVLSETEQIESEFEEGGADAENDPADSEPKYVWAKQAGVRLRAEANTTSEILKTLPAKQKLTLLEEGDFVKVDYDGIVGYIRKDLVLFEEP